MRGIALCVLALVLAASGSAATSSVTALKITLWPNGEGSDRQKTWTLRCEPATGTIARPGEACRKLAAGERKLFAPVPRRAVCTEIYGGPDVARVIGVLEGGRVWATFNRTNGCHIDRWSRFSPWLLPPS
ncbi:MAG: subtilase-type protease inhibitor [Actinomycetota bacterium]|nr:subtilase-type protease inhibitor [Actinomycetota bacterium]